MNKRLAGFWFLIALAASLPALGNVMMKAKGGKHGAPPPVASVLGTGTSATDCLGTGTSATDCLGVQ